MADPQGISFAPTSSWNGTAPTWFRLDQGTAVTWNITGWTIERGRSSELDKTETGHATITIADTDGSFDPTNTSSPFYGGGLDPMRQVAITVQNPVTDEWRHLFKGFVSEWNVDMHTGANLGFVTMEAADGFDLIAAAEMYPGTVSPPAWGTIVPEGAAGDIYFPSTGATTQVRARINQILDDVRWPAGWRHVFSGNNQVQETVYARRSQALEALFDAADAEFPGVANIYMSRRGNVIFHGRYVRFDPESYVSPDGDDIRTGNSGEGGMVCFWNAGGKPEATAGTACALISGVSFRRSKNDIINAAFAAPNAPEREEDAELLTQLDQTSINTYGWRGVSFENLLIKFGNTPPGYTAVEECELIGQYYVDNKSSPQTRVTRLEFSAVGFGLPYSAATWALIFGVEIGDVITLDTTHWGGTGGFSDQDFFVEGIRYEWSPGGAGDYTYSNLRLSLDVSPRAFYTVNPWGTTPDGDIPEE